MKVLYNGNEIEINTELEKGEVELDLADEEDSIDLEDTMELDFGEESYNKLENTAEFFFVGDDSCE